MNPFRTITHDIITLSFLFTWTSQVIPSSMQSLRLILNTKKLTESKTPRCSRCLIFFAMNAKYKKNNSGLWMPELIIERDKSIKIHTFCNVNDLKCSVSDIRLILDLFATNYVQEQTQKEGQMRTADLGRSYPSRNNRFLVAMVQTNETLPNQKCKCWRCQ